MPFKSVTVVMGDTGTSVNQGGASGSTGIQLGGKQLRAAAAEARRVLVEMAAGGASTSGPGAYLRGNLDAWRSRRTWLGAGILDAAVVAKPLRKLSQLVPSWGGAS